MATADSDYARVLSLLTKQQLAPYVSYVKRDDFNGFGQHGKDNENDRVVIRISDGAVVHGKSSGIEAGNYHDRSNPVSHPAFDPNCYRATSESATTYNGESALKLNLEATCKSKHDGDVDYPFTTLIARADSLQPIDVHGTAPQTGDDKNVSVTLDQTFDTFDGRVLPSRLKVDVVGSGFMFWLNLHITETYMGYEFSKNP